MEHPFFKVIKRTKRALLPLLMLCLAVGSCFFHFTLDLTVDHRFSLNPASIRILKTSPPLLKAQLYLAGELSPALQKLQRTSIDLLSQMSRTSNGNIKWETITPLVRNNNDSVQARYLDSLTQLGIKPFSFQTANSDGINTTEHIVFPSVVFSSATQKIVVNLMSGKAGMDEEASIHFSETLLEFKFMTAIEQLVRPSNPIVAYAAGNGEPFNPTVRSLFDVMRNTYRFGIIDLNYSYLDADSIKALLIVKPTKPFSEATKFKIDQYIMNGGSVLWFIDPLYAELDSLLRSQHDFVAFDRNLNLEDLLFKYGVRINSDLVQSIKSARQPIMVDNMGHQPKIVRMPFYYYPLVSSPNKNSISSNLDDVLTVFPASIDTVESPSIKKTILLSTDTLARTLQTPAIVSLQSMKDHVNKALFFKSSIPVAVLLEGKFNSSFAHRASNNLIDSLKFYTGLPFKPTSEKSSMQLVVSDADIITNAVSQTQGPLPMGMQLFENYEFANKDFLMNALQYIVNQNGLLDSRNKELKLRSLNKEHLLANKLTWQLINILTPLILLLLIAFGSFLSTRKYKKPLSFI